ncbi:MAG: hypothetical protein ACR2L1_04540 [Pyrinomonadaceae bacterium]
MKIKVLVVLSLAAFVFLAGCRSASNTNVNVNMANANMATPVVKTNETAATGSVMKTKVEKDLKDKGFADITVDETTTPATLRGMVATKEKMAEAVKIAQESAGKPFENKITVK